MENIIISNPYNFEKRKKHIINESFRNLHFISDFDRTLTHAFIDGGEHVPSLISVLRDENYLIEGYSDKARTLFKQYHPIEIDNSISFKKRKKAMEEWWTKHAELLIKSGLNKKDLEKIAKSKRIKFRKKTLEMITLLNQQNVPFIIFSASGIGDESIIYTLKYHDLYYPNINIISNKYIWDKNGNAIDYNKPLIHTFNKDETLIKKSLAYSKIKDRKNVILLGDSLGDVEMVKGFNYKNLLKIGFLNSDIEKNLKEYKKHYDVVIINDSSMEFVYNFIKEFKKTSK